MVPPGEQEKQLEAKKKKQCLATIEDMETPGRRKKGLRGGMRC